MSQLDFADDVLARIRERGAPYDERAYLFVLAALEDLQGKLPERRHVSGGELAHACRELALAQFGLLSRAVLAHWGVTSTSDFGAIVYALAEVGLLRTQPTDRPEDFTNVYRFGDAFESGYQWGAWRTPEQPT